MHHYAEIIAWAGLFCLAGLVAIPQLSSGSFLRPSYAVIDQNINELLAGTP